jgi:LysM repeat protein
VVLAWSILSIILVAVGTKGSVHPAQANTRTAGSTTEVILTSTVSVTASPVTAASHTMKYVVRSGDTLSGIAARFAVRGGWPTLYAANRRAIGPDPDIIHAGTVLVLHGRKAPARYTVAAGDTLSGIAAEFAVRGGWPALYAANRRAVGPDPGVIHAGTVLTFPHPAAPPPVAPGRAHRRYHRPVPPPSPPAGHRHHRRPATQGAPAAAGMPPWLTTMLLAVGLLILAAFLAEPVLAVRRRRQQAAARQAQARAPQPGQPGPGQPPGTGPAAAGSGQGPASRPPGAQKAHIVLADHHRLAVTCNQRGDTVHVLRPPGEDPKAILKVARSVLPEGPYRELAEKLGIPPSWPIIVADYDRLVVTCSPRDRTVYVLRPPGEDPKAILKVARLVMPEGPYGELADQLGVPASWPMG